MVTLIVTHEVKDFPEWKKGFDNHEPIRIKAGVTVARVYSSVDNPKLVTVIAEFPSAEAAQGFISSADLKKVMEEAGVVGMPDFKILKEMV